LACCEGCWRDVASNDGPGANHSTIADCYAFKNRTVGSNEHVIANVDWGAFDGHVSPKGHFVHVGIAYEATSSDEAAFADVDARVGYDF
jgi:hypothetical protein